MVTWSLNCSEAGGDFVVIQTPLLSRKCTHYNNLLYTTKAEMSVSKQDPLKPRCHSKARSLSRQLFFLPRGRENLKSKLYGF